MWEVVLWLTGEWLSYYNGEESSVLRGFYFGLICDISM